MRKLVAITAAALAAAGMFASSATAAEQACGAVVADAAGVAYVAVDSDGSGVWVYQESNNDPGLQRGGSTMALNESDSCQAGGANPDTAIF